MKKDALWSEEYTDVLKCKGALEEFLRSKFQQGWICWNDNCVRFCQAARKSSKLPNHMIQTESGWRGGEGEEERERREKEKRKKKRKHFCFQNFQKSPKA